MGCSRRNVGRGAMGTHDLVALHALEGGEMKPVNAKRGDVYPTVCLDGRLVWCSCDKFLAWDGKESRPPPWIERGLNSIGGRHAHESHAQSVR